MTAITLDTIRQAAEALANAHLVTTARAALLQEEIRAAIAPIMEEHRARLDGAAADEARAKDRLMVLLAQAPQLFQKPRSFTLNGIRAGYKKDADALDWADDDTLIARIRAFLPELADTLIRTQESVVADAISNLDPAHFQKLGISRITGVDRPFISVGDSDVEKTAKTLIADAMRRQGEDEEPKARKGKAKANAKAEAA